MTALNLFKFMKIVVYLFVLLINAKLNAIEVYFTPSSDCQNKIIELIDKSQNNINIAIYSFTDSKIYNALLKKKNIVKIITDGKQSQGQSSKINLLSASNVKVCKRLSGVMHNKYMIVDNRYVITGSYNWSDNARKTNNENCVVIDDINIAKDYKNNFDKLMIKYCK